MLSSALIEPLLADEIAAQKLPDRWFHVMHYEPASNGSNWVSRVDNASFFYSSQGKFNPAEEFESFGEKLSDESTRQATMCRYPARSIIWLKHNKKPHSIGQIIDACDSLKAWFKQYESEKVDLYFAASYINNPSSAFGHLLMAMRKQSTPKVLATSINFAARTNRDDGFWRYIYNGLAGEYQGQYTLQPLHLKLREYRQEENRDMWRYPLNVNKEEINWILLHLWELKDANFDYYFLDENCGFHILSLIQVAKPQLNLTDEFPHLAIPLDTLKFLFTQNLISSPEQLPAAKKSVKALFEDLNSDQTRMVMGLVENKTFDSSPIAVLAEETQFTIYETARRVLIIKLLSGEKNKDDVGKKLKPIFQKLIELKAHSSTSDNISHKNNTSFSPEKSHEAQRIKVGYLNWNDQNFTTIAYRPLYHGEGDPSFGFEPGSFIELLDTELRYANDKLSLERIKIIALSSITEASEVFDEVSWQLSWQRSSRRLEQHQFLDSSIDFSLGKSYSALGGTGYLMGGYQIRTGNWYDKSQVNGPVISLGYLKTTDNWQFSARFTHLESISGDSANQDTLSSNFSYFLNDSSSLNTTFKIEKIGSDKGETFGLSYSCYF